MKVEIATQQSNSEDSGGFFSEDVLFSLVGCFVVVVGSVVVVDSVVVVGGGSVLF